MLNATTDALVQELLRRAHAPGWAAGVNPEDLRVLARVLTHERNDQLRQEWRDTAPPEPVRTAMYY